MAHQALIRAIDKEGCEVVNWTTPELNPAELASYVGRVIDGIPAMAPTTVRIVVDIALPADRQM